jgi:hypothetical protein
MNKIIYFLTLLTLNSQGNSNCAELFSEIKGKGEFDHDEAQDAYLSGKFDDYFKVDTDQIGNYVLKRPRHMPFF